MLSQMTFFLQMNINTFFRKIIHVRRDVKAQRTVISCLSQHANMSSKFKLYFGGPVHMHYMDYMDLWFFSETLQVSEVRKSYLLTLKPCQMYFIFGWSICLIDNIYNMVVFILVLCVYIILTWIIQTFVFASALRTKIAARQTLWSHPEHAREFVNILQYEIDVSQSISVFNRMTMRKTNTMVPLSLYVVRALA